MHHYYLLSASHSSIFCRRDSFITHRAFCDALAEENNKANEGQLPKIGPNLQCQQIPNLVSSSLPINTNIVPNPQMGGTSEFNHADHKHPLSLPHELMPMPAQKSFNNMAAGTTKLKHVRGKRAPPCSRVATHVSHCVVAKSCTNGSNSDRKNLCNKHGTTIVWCAATASSTTKWATLHEPVHAQWPPPPTTRG